MVLRGGRRSHAPNDHAGGRAGYALGEAMGRMLCEHAVVKRGQVSAFMTMKLSMAEGRMDPNPDPLVVATIDIDSQAQAVEID